jgi:anti-sigma factor RsiW
MSEVRDKHPSDERLQAFLDDALPAREARRIETHVASCTSCAEEVAMWRVLFEDLDTLATHRPHSDFQARVMAGVRLPEALPWAARLEARLGALVPAARPAHLGADLLQDLVEGTLSTRATARARTHIEGCGSCARELEGWTAVMARLSGLERFAPAQGFANRVMAGLAPAAAPVAVRRRSWTRGLAVARRFVPRTRRAWAALSGAAVTPAVTFGLILYTVFSHPTLTPQSLASFAFWQLTDLSVEAWGSLVASALAATRSVGLDGFVGAMVQAPLVAAGGIAIYALGFTLAIRVLYKNLVRRPVRARYASASAS